MSFTIGLVGGGQLGRMIALEARRMGVKTIVLEPQNPCPAGTIADRHLARPYDDREALKQLAEEADTVTFEFENIPVEALEYLAGLAPVYPNPSILHICQNRLREKEFLLKNGFPHAPFHPVFSSGDLQEGIQILGFPCVLKTADFGYDGKGQVRINSKHDVDKLIANFPPGRHVLEKWISFSGEYSVMVASNGKDSTVTYQPTRNVHRNHILHTSSLPSGLSGESAEDARALAIRLASALGLKGLLAVELFLDPDFGWRVNELAPRPHNSGHITQDTCPTSQFEQMVRIGKGWPIGNTEPFTQGIMLNLLGDLWTTGEPDWTPVLQSPFAHLHLYEKTEARKGRKMGHINFTGCDFKLLENAISQLGFR